MANTTGTQGAEGENQEEENSSTEDENLGAGDETALGDKGKKALDAMKAKWKAATAAQKAAETLAAELQAKADGKEADHTASLAAQKVKDEALAKANERILKSEIRREAKGQLANPDDALVFLDLTEIEVSEDGSVNESALKQALDDLLEERPYLAAQGERRFTGEANSGHRKGGTNSVKQLTQSDLDSMSSTEINKARRAGQFKNLLGS